MMQGSKYCKHFSHDRHCILEYGLGEKLSKIGKDDPKKCRFKAYKMAANVLGFKERAPLPICVRLEIQHLFGRSEVGFQKKKEK